MADTQGFTVRKLLRNRHTGILSTQSKKFAGFPFASLTPYVLDHRANPIILISELAEHTKNIISDPHVSLFVFESLDDAPEHARATLLGHAKKLEAPKYLVQRYLRYHPKAYAYLEMQDFSFYRIEAAMIRYIGGFAKIHWLPATSYNLPVSDFAEHEEELLADINNNYRTLLIGYCSSRNCLGAEDARLLGIDCDGFDIQTKQIIRVDYETPATNLDEARKQLITALQA